MLQGSGFKHFLYSQLKYFFIYDLALTMREGAL